MAQSQNSTAARPKLISIQLWMQEPHVFPGKNVLPHQISTDRSPACQSLGASSALRRIQNQPAARHAEEMLVEKLNYLPCRVVCLVWALPYALEPVVEGDNIGARDVERVSQHGCHIPPRLPSRILDMIDRR